MPGSQLAFRYADEFQGSKTLAEFSKNIKRLGKRTTGSSVKPKDF